MLRIRIEQFPSRAKEYDAHDKESTSFIQAHMNPILHTSSIQPEMTIIVLTSSSSYRIILTDCMKTKPHTWPHMRSNTSNDSSLIHQACLCEPSPTSPSDPAFNMTNIFLLQAHSKQLLLCDSELRKSDLLWSRHCTRSVIYILFFILL